ncbi:MAG: RES family NAD+ phosphorylase, partial [Pseudomonas sp.]
MVAAQDLGRLPAKPVRAYRLVNSKFPPIAIFDDVADADEFEELYALQSLTNPRMLNQAGQLELIMRSDIPFGIPGCSYATAPFTHVNPDGSRFSDGSFGVLYLADCMETAIAEVRYHQQFYWSRVPDLRYDRFVFRG